jgi:hypothetical protein
MLGYVIVLHHLHPISPNTAALRALCEMHIILCCVLASSPLVPCLHGPTAAKVLLHWHECMHQCLPASACALAMRIVNPPQDCDAKMTYFLPRFEGVLLDPESAWADWQDEYTQVWVCCILDHLCTRHFKMRCGCVASLAISVPGTSR